MSTIDVKLWVRTWRWQVEEVLKMIKCILCFSVTCGKYSGHVYPLRVGSNSQCAKYSIFKPSMEFILIYWALLSMKALFSNLHEQYKGSPNSFQQTLFQWLELLSVIQSLAGVVDSFKKKKEARWNIHNQKSQQKKLPYVSFKLICFWQLHGCASCSVLGLCWQTK